jgi:hypothetical protein
VGSWRPPRPLLSGLLLGADVGHVFHGRNPSYRDAAIERSDGDGEDIAMGPNGGAGGWCRPSPMGRPDVTITEHRDSDSFELPMFDQIGANPTGRR